MGQIEGKGGVGEGGIKDGVWVWVSVRVKVGIGGASEVWESSSEIHYRNSRLTAHRERGGGTLLEPTSEELRIRVTITSPLAQKTAHICS